MQIPTCRLGAGGGSQRVCLSTQLPGDGMLPSDPSELRSVKLSSPRLSSLSHACLPMTLAWPLSPKAPLLLHQLSFDLWPQQVVPDAWPCVLESFPPLPAALLSHLRVPANGSASRKASGTTFLLSPRCLCSRKCWNPKLDRPRGCEGRWSASCWCQGLQCGPHSLSATVLAMQLDRAELFFPRMPGQNSQNRSPKQNSQDIRAPC